MNAIESRNSLIHTSNEIFHSKLTTIFTKYGKYKMKSYKDSDKEYLALMHPTFFDASSPIVYVHSHTHNCETDHEGVCYWGSQFEIALKMVQKSGGVVIYPSEKNQSIAGVLEEINARKLEENNGFSMYRKSELDQKTKIAYPSLGFIFKDLKFQRVQLVSNDARVVDTLALLGIELEKLLPSISFIYGEESVSVN